jgi:ketosteroid isomerase-like protein
LNRDLVQRKVRAAHWGHWSNLNAEGDHGMKKAIGLVSALVAVFALAGWQGSASAAQKNKESAGGVEATIMKLNERITQAALKGDAATFQELYAEDYVSISAVTGATSTKADLINNVKSGKLKYDSIAPSDVKIHVYGNTALVTAKADVKGKFGDQDMSGSYRSSRLFVNRGGKWLVVFFQSTKIPTEIRTG